MVLTLRQPCGPMVEGLKGDLMASILTFSTDRPHRVRALSELPADGGELVAMGHVNLETVVETVRVLRQLDPGHLLDPFNATGAVGDPPDGSEGNSGPEAGKRKRRARSSPGL